MKCDWCNKTWIRKVGKDWCGDIVVCNYCGHEFYDLTKKKLFTKERMKRVLFRTVVTVACLKVYMMVTE